MADDEHHSGLQNRVRPFAPLLGLNVGGLVYSLLPHGAFGTYDVAIRAAITGLTAGTAVLGLHFVLKRRSRATSG